MKVMIALNTAWNLYNFRSGLIRALVAQGHDVVAVAPHDEYSARLTELGCRYIALPMDNGGTNPLRDFGLLLRFLRLLREERPDVYLGYTVKPNVYGSMAAHLLGIPVVNNVAGLGAVFIKQNWLTKVVRGLYKVALTRSYCVFFQNNEDLTMFVQSGLVERQRTIRLPGSGINLNKFAYTPCVHHTEKTFRFLLVARMLRDKGVVEYVEAARSVQKLHPNVEFGLLGFVDAQNPTAISSEEIKAWEAEGVVQYYGVTDNVGTFMAAADCIVLPSYREGVPRSLLEAAAIGRPIVTTDVPGCRDVVDDGVNGYLCQPYDAQDLAAKMQKLLGLPSEQLSSMGVQGREKMVREFDEQIVVDRYLNVIANLGKHEYPTGLS